MLDGPMSDTPAETPLAVITGAQLRRARRLLGWSPKDLERRSGVPAAAITRAEGPLGIESVTIRNVNAMRTALEAAGVVFIDERAS
jgi:transcriptional regulator with XRE-family HTH domain